MKQLCGSLAKSALSPQPDWPAPTPRRIGDPPSRRPPCAKHSRMGGASQAGRSEQSALAPARCRAAAELAIATAVHGRAGLSTAARMASDALTTDELGQLLLDAAGAGDAEQVAKLLETGAPLSWCRPVSKGLDCSLLARYPPGRICVGACFVLLSAIVGSCRKAGCAGAGRVDRAHARRRSWQIGGAEPASGPWRRCEREGKGMLNLRHVLEAAGLPLGHLVPLAIDIGGT